MDNSVSEDKMAAGTFPHIGSRPKEEIMALFSRHVSSGKVRFFQQAGIDFVMGRREGPYLWDISGEKRVIDCHCNGGVFNLGHRNPVLVETLIQSLQELDIGNHHLLSEQRALLAQRLAEHTPGDLTYTVFGVSGGEAIDLAIKIARAYTQRPKIISARRGYHGHTGFALAAGDEKFRAPFGPMPPGFVQVPFGDLTALQAAVDSETAAVILETVPATAGILVPEPDYLPGVREICDRASALLIIDEVQTGLGRTGLLWGVEHFGVIPDIMVIGKGLSGGLYPITATCFREKLEVVFHPDPFIHISTFGGAEIGCPVALKVLEISSDPAFLEHVQELAAFFASSFDGLRRRHPQVLTGLRQLGMMMGIELAHEAYGPLFSRFAYENGLLCVYAYHDPRVVQFLPPLTIDRALAEEIVERVDRTLSVLAAFAGGSL
jgi:acetylornithine/succinyldiaminopimelate/putrescine aminotransferase